MKDKKVIFMGTPSYAVPVLEELIKNTNVIAVVTQPDKEANRGKKITICPIKKVAQDHNILVLQPIKIKEEYQEILKYNPDIIITCAYGQILPKELIYAPPYKTINVHASLLPKLRGGAPIHHAIINGEEKTGITIMETDVGMDSGDIIYQEEILITKNDTYDTLSNKLSVLGAQTLIKVLPEIFARTNQKIKQNDNEVTIGYTIKKEEEQINFNKNAKDVVNQIKGLSSNPGAYAILDNERIKIFYAEIEKPTNELPGTITKITKDAVYVATKDYEIKITDIQFPNKKRMYVKEMLNGYNKEKLINKRFQ